MNDFNSFQEVATASLPLQYYEEYSSKKVQLRLELDFYTLKLADGAVSCLSISISNYFNLTFCEGAVRDGVAPRLAGAREANV